MSVSVMRMCLVVPLVVVRRKLGCIAMLWICVEGELLTVLRYIARKSLPDINSGVEGDSSFFFRLLVFSFNPVCSNPFNIYP